MAWWRRAQCPVRPVEREWIEQSMQWFTEQFGRHRSRAEVVLPTDDFFPGTYRGTRRDVRVVLERLCAHMGIDPGRVRLEHDASEVSHEMSVHVPIHTEWTGAAGHHRVHAEPVRTSVVRHEALFVRMEVGDLRCSAVVAVG